MNSEKKNLQLLEDGKIQVKMKLSALWVSVMLCYIYGDYFTLLVPGRIENIMAKITPVGPTTPVSLLLFSALMAIPAVMVFLSLTLRPTINRWLNLILGGFYTIIMLLTMFMDSFDPWWTFYMFLGIIEVLLTALIVGYAWNWPKQEGYSSSHFSLLPKVPVHSSQ